MPEVDIGHDELSIVGQDLTDFLEFALLHVTHVLEQTHGRDEIKAHIIKCDPFASDVYFLQVLGWLMNREIDTIIPDVRSEQGAQRAWPAADVEEATLPSLSELIEYSGALEEPKTRL